MAKETLGATAASGDGEGRGSAVDLSPEYHQRIMEKLEELKAAGSWATMEQLGALAAKAVGRERDFGRGTIERFLKLHSSTPPPPGQRVSDETVSAMCKLVGLPYPVLTAKHPDEADWFEAGGVLRKLRPTLFSELLAEARERAELALAEVELDARRKKKK